MKQVILPLVVRLLTRSLLPVEIAVIEICIAGQLDILSGGDWNRWRVWHRNRWRVCGVIRKLRRLLSFRQYSCHQQVENRI